MMKPFRLTEEKYWVASQGEEPTRIYFSALEAIQSNEPYLDSFDETGNKVRSMKRVDDCNYTTDF